jgi:hypothetical protein
MADRPQPVTLYTVLTGLRDEQTTLFTVGHGLRDHLCDPGVGDDVTQFY